MSSNHSETTTTTTRTHISVNSSRQNALTDEIKTELREVFDLYVNLRTNTVTVHQLERIVKDYGFSPSKIHFRKVLSVCDISRKDEQIPYEKYEEVMANLTEERNAAAGIMKAFDLFDIHNDGCITFASLCELCRKMDTGFSEDDIEEMIVEADIDRDGVIDLHDFAAIMKLTDINW